MKYKGQDVTSRELTQDDAQFGGKFDANRKQSIVKFPDGHEEVVNSDQLKEQSAPDNRDREAQNRQQEAQNIGGGATKTGDRT